MRRSPGSGSGCRSAPDPSEVFTAIVDDVAGALRLGYCAVSLRRGDTLEVAAEQGIRGREPQFVCRSPIRATRSAS